MVDYVVRTSEGSADHVFSMLERLGFRVGQRLAEKYPVSASLPRAALTHSLIRYTRDRGRFQDLLEVIKFICKDFWTEVFRKQIDNLRTNHKGVYVLADNRFRLFAHMSPTISKARPPPPRAPIPYRSLPSVQEVATNYTVFSCGLIRGALANLGIACIVTSEITMHPACTSSRVYHVCA